MKKLLIIFILSSITFFSYGQTAKLTSNKYETWKNLNIPVDMDSTITETIILIDLKNKTLNAYENKNTLIYNLSISYKSEDIEWYYYSGVSLIDSTAYIISYEKNGEMIIFYNTSSPVIVYYISKSEMLN